jgi:hypothetical protein
MSLHVKTELKLYIQRVAAGSIGVVLCEACKKVAQRGAKLKPKSKGAELSAQRS